MSERFQEKFLVGISRIFSATRLFTRINWTGFVNDENLIAKPVRCLLIRSQQCNYLEY